MGTFQKAKDMAGLRFGRLVVTDKAPRINAHARWTCRCDCGNTTEVLGAELRKGATVSCGCKRAEPVHGMTKKHPIHRCWTGMLTRCYNPKRAGFPDYGGRGIIVCDRWHTFTNFRDDMLPTWRPGLTIERDDVNGNYCPENCRWVPRSEQNRNTRRSVWVQTPFGVMQRCDARLLWSYWAVDKFPRASRPG